jgi:hypothetical protein
MPFTESVPGEEGSAVGAKSPHLPVSGVNAHLRLSPRDPNDFRVVVTFHHTDGSLCEAALKPVEAAGLMSEILHVIDRGNDQGHRAKSGLLHGAGDD